MSTVTGTLKSIITNTIEKGSVEVALCGYGSQVPRVVAQAMLARATTTPNEVAVDSNGDFDIDLPGNDLIVPVGTYYTFTIKDSNGDAVQINAYQFKDGTNYDLNTQDPFDPSGPPLPPLPPIYNELLVIPYNPTPNFPGNQYTAWQFRLTGDAVATMSGLVPGNLYTFILQQGGGWTFTWPPGTWNPTPICPGPNSWTVQTFVAFANQLFAIAPGTYYPS